MDTKTKDTPILYMTLGHPGSGKTFFAQQYAKSLGLPLIDIEQLRHVLFVEPSYTTDEDKVVLGVADYMLDQFLSANLSVVLDGMNSTRTRRFDLREKARAYGVTPLVVWVQTDVSTAFERARNRDRRNPHDKYARELPNDEFEKQSAKVKLPQNEDYVVVSGKHVFRNQMNVVARKIATLDAKRRSKAATLGGRVDLSRRKQRPRS